MRDLIIIGGGPAGYTAAIYAARARLYPLVYEGNLAGGQLTMTTLVENYPGFKDGVDGPVLMADMRSQAERFGAKLVQQQVDHVDFLSYPYRVTAGGVTEETKAVIIATGGTARKLGLDSEQALYGHGVSTCATCDAFFYRGKKVAVVGGGDSAMEEADFITRFASEVHLLVRRDVLRASKAMQERVLNNPKIQIHWNTVVKEIHDVTANKVTGVTLRNAVTNEEELLTIDGLFTIIGHDPNSKIFHGHVHLDDEGYVLVEPGTTKTSVPGVFAAGDVVDRRYRQAITSAGTGCMAALDALHYLENLDNPSI